MDKNSHLKLLPKTVQGSEDGGEVKESEEINRERGRDES